MTVSVSIHVRPEDVIVHRTSSGRHWITIGTALVFANPTDMKRLRAAINDQLKAMATDADRANARLIAAAPDLYEACLLFLIYDRNARVSDVTLMLDYDAALDAARAVIAKVEDN